jgi:hypothetical protein
MALQVEDALACQVAKGFALHRTDTDTAGKEARNVLEIAGHMTRCDFVLGQAIDLVIFDHPTSAHQKKPPGRRPVCHRLWCAA